MKKHFLVVLTGLFIAGCAAQSTKTARTATPANVKDNDVWEEVQAPAVEPEESCTRCAIANQQKEMQEILQKIIEKGETISVPSVQPAAF